MIDIEMTMSEAVTSVLLLVGAVFSLLASVGLARMPDLYMRMQAATKAGTLGVGSLLIAVGVRFASLEVLAMCLVITVFLFLTAPVASHLVGRAAYIVRIKPWSGSGVDELAGCYDPETNRLSPTPDAARKAAEADMPNVSEYDGDTTMYGIASSEDPDLAREDATEEGEDAPTGERKPRLTA